MITSWPEAVYGEHQELPDDVWQLLSSPYPTVSARGPDKWNQLHFQVASVAFLSPAKGSLMREHVYLVRTKSWTRAEST